MEEYDNDVSSGSIFFDNNEVERRDSSSLLRNEIWRSKGMFDLNNVVEFDESSVYRDIEPKFIKTSQQISGIDDYIEGEEFLSPELHKELSISKNHILGIRDNWDGEGSPKFSPSLVLKSIKWLKIFAISALNKYNFHIPIPQIEPVADNTIDIRWQTVSQKLIVNFANDPKEPICFFGKSEDGTIIEGKTKYSDANLVLIAWLEKFQ